VKAARRLASSFALAIGLLPSIARAHLMPAHQGTINVLGDSVFSVLMIPVSALHGADDDNDGCLSTLEVAAHSAELQAEIGARFQLYGITATQSSPSSSGKHDFVSVGAEHNDAESPAEVSRVSSTTGSKSVLVFIKSRFVSQPDSVRVKTDLFGTSPGEDQFTIRGTYGKQAESVTLRGPAAEHAFFQVALGAVALLPAQASVNHRPTGFGGVWLCSIAAIAASLYAALRMKASPEQETRTSR
jgi:hypothetical protein